MSVVCIKPIVGAIVLFVFLWLLPPVAQASSPSIVMIAPANVTAGSSAPVLFLVQSDGAPVSGATVSVGVLGGASVSPASAVTNATGYAAVTISAAATTGEATILADSSGATASVNISIVAGPPASSEVSTASTLLPADAYSTCVVNAKVRDAYGNDCAGWPVNFTVDGTRHVVNAGSGGMATYVLGPCGSSHTYSVTVEANGLARSVSVRFFAVNLYLQGYPASVTAGQDVSITALLLDDLTPAPGIRLTFTVYSPGNLATPASYTGTTDANGKVTFTFKTSPTSGINTVIVSNQSLGGDIRSASIRGTSGLVGQIILSSTPASPIYADGTTGYTLRIWAKDAGGNLVKNEEITVVRNLVDNYTVTTNANGYAEIGVGASSYVGDVRFDAYAANGVTKDITLSYVAGPPAMTVIKAVPNVIASAEVVQTTGVTDIHSTDVIVQVTDQWHHPLPGCDLTVSSMNTSAGNITGDATGQTDSNGEFYTAFTLGNNSRGTGTVDVMAVSDNLSSTYTITYTNNSFLSVDTTVTPRNVTVNDTINVQISIKGIGWNNRPQPVDMMLITDRSGSMDWYSNMVYPANGEPQTGTTTQEGTYFLVGTFDNTQTRYSELQFMLSSPYTNFANGSYYYSLYVRDTAGNQFYGTRSQNENYVKITNARARVYTVYAKFEHSGVGGYPPYSFSVLTRPLRLGSYYDTDSAAKVAAKQLVDNMSSQDQMGLVSFNTASTLDSSLRTVTGANKTYLKNTIDGLDANGGTSIYTGIQRARQEFAARGRSSIKHVAILLTDGYSQSPANDIIEANNARDEGITIFTIGMGMADAETLGRIANITGGCYYHVVSDLELAQRYQEIFKNVSEVVANESSMDIMSARSLINGTIISDAEYVPNSAVVTFTNGTSAFVDPIIAIDDTNYTLSWDPGSINCNQIWRVSYNLRVMHGGYLTPITGNSTIAYTRSDGSNGTVTFVSDSIFCRDTVGGQVSNPSPLLQVRIIAPANGTAIDELRTVLGWSVTYTWTGEYVQRISIMPEDGTEWADIARGFPGNRTTSGSYSYGWNLERVPTGNYTIMVYVTDGTYDAADHVTISIPYKSGKIILQ
ncbi:MAG: Bacterial Ig-like domain (group 1) [Methanocella sp. PtaU1.Bin125]|nr:MAG: Bacterial Ig-like domain (group 1) [Methanocella sp. PtaU1.Bin125]